MRVLSYILLVIAVGICPAAAFDGPTQSKGGIKTAPASKSDAKPGKANPAANGAAKADPKTTPPGQKLYNAGIKAYEAGKHVEAINHFGAAFKAGGLEKPQMAKALYYRGLAYRKKDMPGQAISDLTSAVWLNDGLTAAQKSDALSNRIAAYREAGISDVPAVPESAIGSKAPSSSGTSSAVGWQTATSGATASPGSEASTPSQGPAVAAAPASNSSTSASPSSASDSGGSGGGGFFSSIANFFTGGGGSSNEPTPSQSKEPDTAAPIVPKSETSSWYQTTQVATAQPPTVPKKPAKVTTPFATQVAAASPPAKPKKHAEVTSPFVTEVATTQPPAAAPSRPKSASPPSGKYRLQVAAVRSRSEADAVAASLMQKYAGELGSRRPVVDEAVIGSMGTFYRVRVGPYANAKEPRQLCGTLRTSGFDCLVVTK